MIILIVVLALFLATSADAATYWASPTGTSSTCTNNPTDPGSNYLSLINAIRCSPANTGDTIMLKPGTYSTHHGLEWWEIQSGTPSAYKTIRGSTGNRDDVIITRQSSYFAYWSKEPGSGSSQWRYIEFRDLTFDGTHNDPENWGALFTLGGNVVIPGSNPRAPLPCAQDLDIRDCDVSHSIRWRNVKVDGRATNANSAVIDTNSQMMGVLGCTGCEFLGGEWMRSTYSLYLSWGFNLVDGVYFHDNLAMGIQMYIGAFGPFIHHNIIRNSRFSHNALHDGVYGVENFVCGTNLVVAGGVGNQVYNNVFDSKQSVPCQTNGSGGISVFSGAVDTQIYNNTFYNLRVGIEIGCFTSGTRIRNNAGSALSSQGNPFGSTATVSEGGLIEHYSCGGGNTYTSQSNSVSASPGFINATVGSTANFQLSSAGSPFVNVGQNLSTGQGNDGNGISMNMPAVDANGFARTGIWDLGACEFGGTSPCPSLQVGTPGPPPASIAITTPTSPTYIASTPTLTVGGTAACPASSVQKVTWTNSRGGSGTATGTLTWTATNIPLIEHRVQDLTFTATCADATTAQAALKVRGNGVSQAVLMLPLDENTGTTAKDISGRNNNGTFAGSGTTWIPGKYGSALNFNGSGSLNIADADNLDLSVMTVSMWVNAAGLTSDGRALLVKNYRYLMYASMSPCIGGAPLGGISFITNGLACQPNVPLPGTWTHLAFTYDGGAVRLYRNGLQVAIALYSELPDETTGNLQIGASQFGENFSGGVDEVSVYNTALPLNNGTGDLCADSVQSIIKLMNCPMQAAPLPTGLTVKYGALTIQKGSDATVTFGAQQ